MIWFQWVALVTVLLSSSAWSRSLPPATKYPHVTIPLNPGQRLASRAETCTTQRCKDYAKHLIDSLAPNYTAIDPCTDFERYSCDGWRSRHSFRSDQAYLSVTSVLMDEIQENLHQLLEGPYGTNQTLNSTQKEYDMKNFQKMKRTYQACMDENAIYAYGITPVTELLAQFEKQFPINGSSLRTNGTDNQLSDALTWLDRHGVSGLISAGVSPDDRNPNTTIIWLSSPSIQLPKPYYTKDSVLADFTRAVAQTLQVVASDKPLDQAPISASANRSLYERAARIVNFEKAIAENLPDAEVAESIDYTYQLRTLSQIQSMAPQIGIERFLRAIAPAGYSITPNSTVIVNDLNWFINMSKNIIQATSRQTLHDYLQWKIIKAWQGRLHRKFTAPLQRFTDNLSGKDPNAVPERWRLCVSEVDNSLSHILGGAFIERMFSRKDKDLGDQIIHDIKNVFRDNLKGLEWMSEASKAVAAIKVGNIIQKVGYQTKNPNEESPQDLDAYYQSLNITSNYFNNGITSYEFAYRKSWESLLRPTDRDQWDMTTPTVNAYFNPPLNEIVFPAGILQMPFFAGDLPEYVSYGAFGATAGHELTHGFDDNGSKYDAEGNLRDWWDSITVANFKNKTDCFVKQFSEYFVEGLDGEKVPVNGQLTLGENLADSGGLNSAYRAWKKREGTSTAMNTQLPGLEKFTNDQLFFMSYANSWCGATRKEALLQQVLTDPHSPDDKRVLGPLDNSVDFKKAFNCPVKTAKCALW